jgi:adenylate kinase
MVGNVGAMKCVFISGIPASGKSYLAAKLAKETGARHVRIDDLRDEMGTDPELKKWTDFYWNQDEKEYWRVTSCDQQWENLKKQSEAFWPIIQKRIKAIRESGESTIFEGVNILPHLAHKDLDFGGVVLLGESFDVILERNRRDPRWGKTDELQTKEAEAFWNCERPRYKSEAEKYGFKACIGSNEAERELVRLLQ